MVKRKKKRQGKCCQLLNLSIDQLIKYIYIAPCVAS